MNVMRWIRHMLYGNGRAEREGRLEVKLRELDAATDRAIVEAAALQQELEAASRKDDPLGGLVHNLNNQRLKHFGRDR